MWNMTTPTSDSESVPSYDLNRLPGTSRGHGRARTIRTSTQPITSRRIFPSGSFRGLGFSSFRGLGFSSFRGLGFMVNPAHSTSSVQHSTLHKSLPGMCTPHHNILGYNYGQIHIMYVRCMAKQGFFYPPPL